MGANAPPTDKEIKVFVEVLNKETATINNLILELESRLLPILPESMPSLAENVLTSKEPFTPMGKDLGKAIDVIRVVDHKLNQLIENIQI